MVVAVPKYRNISVRAWMQFADIKAISDKYCGRKGEDFRPGMTDPKRPECSVGIISKYLPRIFQQTDYVRPLSFDHMLSGADVLILGPGTNADEIRAFSDSFPGLNSIHFVDAYESVFNHIDSDLESRSVIPPVYGWRVNIMELPKELYSSMDLIYERNLFDKYAFSSEQFHASVVEIIRTLKRGGVFHRGCDILADLSCYFQRFSLYMAAYEMDDYQGHYQKLVNT